MTDQLRIPWLESLAKNLKPAQRKKLLIAITQQLRKSNAQRIRAQVNADGSAFAPRSKMRAKKGKIKRRAMFAKLRTTRYMKIRSTADEGKVYISGNAAGIAQVHQEGLYARIEKGKPWRTKYPKRDILGFSQQDIREVEAVAFKYLSDGLL